MSKKQSLSEAQRQENRKALQEQETHEMLLAEDAVQTTAYLANAPDCCSEDERLKNVLGMLGADVMDEDVYHGEDQHPKLQM